MAAAATKLLPAEVLDVRGTHDAYRQRGYRPDRHPLSLRSPMSPVLFIPGATLPDQVFRGAASLGFMLTDSAILTSREFWPILQALADRFGDRSISAEPVSPIGQASAAGALLSPGDDAQTLRKWLASRVVSASESNYIEIRVLAFTGSSGEWGVWCDQDRELCVLGVPSRTLGSVRESLAVGAWPWYEVGEVGELLAPAFHPDPVPPALVSHLRRHYASARL